MKVVMMIMKVSETDGLILIYNNTVWANSWYHNTSTTKYEEPKNGPYVYANVFFWEGYCYLHDQKHFGQKRSSSKHAIKPFAKCFLAFPKHIFPHS